MDATKYEEGDDGNDGGRGDGNIRMSADGDV